MKLYYVETQWGNKLIDAKTLAEAKSKVEWDWANSGKRKLTCVRFKKIESKEYVIDTDYK